jgi:hypothetical protein
MDVISPDQFGANHMHVRASTIELGQERADKAPVDHLCLYNRAAFSMLNISETDKYLRLDCKDEDDSFIGSIVGVETDDSFISGYHASFGGIDLVHAHERVERVADMVRGFMRNLSDRGLQNIIIRAKPMAYSVNEPSLYYVLMNSGFFIKECQINAYFETSNIISLEKYYNSLPHSARRTLKRGLCHGLVFQEAENLLEWEDGYRVLQENRERKSRKLSLSFEYIQNLRKLFPGDIRMFLLKQSERTIASALYYHITSKIGRVMFWGDARHELPQSPMNVLVYHLIHVALKEDTAIVDLGMTSFGRLPESSGVLAFKQHVGAKTCLCATFCHRIS